MDPEDFSPNPEHLVKMPDRLRIQQRLGQISINDTAQIELTRIISRRAGDQFSPENFVGEIIASVNEYTHRDAKRRASSGSAYPDEYIRKERDAFIAKRMPKLITALLMNDFDRREVLWYWFSEEYARLHPDEPINHLSRSKFIQTRINETLDHGPPRKAKKEEKKKHSRTMRPHTTARHNGRH